MTDIEEGIECSSSGIVRCTPRRRTLGDKLARLISREPTSADAPSSSTFGGLPSSFFTAGEPISADPSVITSYGEQGLLALINNHAATCRQQKEQQDHTSDSKVTKLTSWNEKGWLEAEDAGDLTESSVSDDSDEYNRRSSLYTIAEEDDAVDSTFAIYSQDENKMHNLSAKRKIQHDDINKESSTLKSDLHSESLTMDPTLDNDPALPRDCNYGNVLESAYEEFGIERELILLEKKDLFAGRKRNKGTKAIRKRVHFVSQPVDVDEVSMSVSSRMTMSSQGSTIELLDAYAANKPLCLLNACCAEPETSDFDHLHCQYEAETNMYERIIDNMDFAINGKAACDDYYHYDCRSMTTNTTAGGDSLSTYLPGVSMMTVDLSLYEEDEDGCDSTLDVSDHGDSGKGNNGLRVRLKRRGTQRKGSDVNDTVVDAMKMQKVVFVSPTVDDPNSKIGLLA